MAANMAAPLVWSNVDGSLQCGQLLMISFFTVHSLQLYKFTVVARDGGKVPLEGFATVSVILIDVNDNPPTFEPAVHQVGRVFRPF